MSRFTKKIKDKFSHPIQVAILAAGIGARTKSYEPRCLLKYNSKIILETQLSVLSERFPKSEISIVCGHDSGRIIKKVGKQHRIIENQIYENTNSGESLKLAVNNSLLDNFMFMHGDLVISYEIFNSINLNSSFILVDSMNKFEEKEVGVTVVDGKVSVLSYNLPVKWCQIAYFTGEEMNILRKLLIRQDFNSKYILTFEIINKVIELGGSFKSYDIGTSFIKEIDSLKDINNETTS